MKPSERIADVSLSPMATLDWRVVLLCWRVVINQERGDERTARDEWSQTLFHWQRGFLLYGQENETVHNIHPLIQVLK